MLLTYLESHADELLSAQEIGDALSGKAVSLSAVYRNLAELETEGLVHRDHGASVREAFYRYVGADACRDTLHLSCMRCGRTFHMGNAGTQQLLSAVELAEGFSVDKSETVLYGTCELCRKQ